VRNPFSNDAESFQFIPKSTSTAVLNCWFSIFPFDNNFLFLFL